MSALRDLGLIHYPQPRHLSLTDAGRARAQRRTALRTLADLHAAWCARLPERQAVMLRYLIGRYPKSVDRDELAERTEQSPTSGSFSANVSALKGLGVVAYPAPRRVAATALLFPALPGKEGG